jgi:hypothetical protein
VELRLVGDRDADDGGAVVLAGHVEVAEPADQWSSRWPSTRIAYLVGEVFIRALQLADDGWGVRAGDGRCGG